jgi:hypothetical protein
MQSSDWLLPLASGKQDLLKRAAAEGIATLDARYMRIEAAVEECGFKDQFKVMSKMLSKFVHPTAMQILGVSDDAKHALQRDWFFGLGCTFFFGAFGVLEGGIS